jgi:acetolactate synthase-1/2/3 large subunit
MRVADYIANFIHKKLETKKVYMLTGGGAMFLNDAVAKHPELEAVCNHHEQACAMASVGHAKYSNGFAVSILTTGCGATNAITGLLDAWQDNTKCFFISGQVKKKETSYNSHTELRQFGIQEANIVSVVRSLSKYSIMVNDPYEIAYHLEKAYFMASSGRPGPVWIDVPLDVQGATIDVNKLKHFDPAELQEEEGTKISAKQLADLQELLQTAKRPIILAGNGIRLSGAIADFKNFISKYKIPVVSSYLALDLISNDDPLYVGPVGIKGDRAANFAIQNSDLIIAIGNRLSVGVTGFEYKLFAREAKLVVVDIDPKEHKKDTVRIDHFIHSDAKLFLQKAFNELKVSKSDNEWKERVVRWKNKWSTSIIKYSDSDDRINKYTFVQHLNKHLKDNSAVVSDAGSAYYVTSQALSLRSNQRYITSGAQADMGYTVPAAIGVANAINDEVIAITGDGSLQLNIQELQTIVHYQYPIKLFVWNNNGYLSIRTTQKKFFEGRFIGTDPKSGVTLPDLQKISEAYGIKFFRVNKVDKLDGTLKDVLSLNEPVICEVMCLEDQEVIPTTSSLKKPDGTMVSKPLEDMYPFLDREEFLKEMIVSPVEE